MSPRGIRGATESASAVCSLLLLACFCLIPTNGQSYMTVTSRGYTTTETGEPTFTCLRSSPDLDADVFIGRHVYTYNDINDPSNGQPPPSISSSEGIPPSTVYTTRLDTTISHSSYGVFYCAGWKDGVWTDVPTIFLRSDAKFVPTSGRFSKTVNTGDVNVTVDFTELEASAKENNWRFNGTTDPNEVLVPSSSIYGELTSYTIPGEVSVDNEGVYEIHLGGERGQARAGLLRIIVRACPAGRYDESGGCVQTCPSCYNGGVCHAETGQCLCAPGFRGNNCEIACGANRYGRICEYRCDYVDDDGGACAGLQVCIPDPYGCSCMPGYKGLDCTTECEAGTFGASCTEECHCASGACDRFTGVCSGTPTTCLPEWTGVNCQECVEGRYGPNCDVLSLIIEKANKGQAAFHTCNLEGGVIVSNADPVFKLYRRMGTEDTFNEADITMNGSNYVGGNYKFSFLVRNVRVGEIFYCAVSDVNNYQSIEMEADGEYVQPELPSDPEVAMATNESVTLMWDAWNEATDVGDSPLQKYRVYVKNQSSDWTEVQRTDALAPSQEITDLDPDTDYVFGVRAVRPGAGGGGARREVEGRTQCSPPTEGPSSVNVTNGTGPGQLIVSWQNPDANEANCRSGFLGIRIYHTISNEDGGGVRKRAVESAGEYTDVPLNASSGYNLTTLDPFSRYIIQVVVRNMDSESPRGPGIEIFTAEEPAPAPSVSVIANATAIKVVWSAASPEHLNGNLQGYEISYRQIQPQVMESVVIPVASTMLVNNVYVIKEGIMEGSTYEVQVRAINGVGPGPWSGLNEVVAANPVRPVNIALITGIVIGIILLILLIVLFILVVRSCKKRQLKRVERINSTELVDNVLYEAGPTTPQQNGTNAAVHIGTKPLIRNPADTEYAYVSHERNSLLSENLGTIDLTVTDNVHSATSPTTPNGKSRTLPLLATAGDAHLLYAKPEKRSDVQSVPILASPTMKEAGTDPSDGEIYENVSLPGAIAIEQLVEYVETKQYREEDGFTHEFGLLRVDEVTPQTVATKPENKSKNRFKNINTFDHSRVVLPKVNGDPHSDYYNASHIPDHHGTKTFIAAQAPNTASINDFWRMIWHENICTVVMVANAVEGGKDRCTVYWPKEMGDKLTFGNIEVKLRTSEIFSDHEHRVLDVKQVNGGETRSVHQFHYLSWPDMGVPQYSTTLISFTQAVKHVHRRITANTQGLTPMLVHCSAGVGRTGTFISLYCMLDQIKEEKRVNIFGFIQSMRENRPHMVQTADQYTFIHTALVEAYMSANTDVPVTHFEAKLVSLREINPGTNKQNIEQEFEILNQLTPPAGPLAFKAAVIPDNIDKNRYQNVLPMEKNRPCLVTKGESGSTDYINASFLNTFMRKDVFIATQMPLPHTTGDIWRLVYDWKCPAIVMLNDLDPADKSCAQYWPNQDSVKFGPLAVSILSAETSNKNYVMRKFQIKGKKKDVQNVKQFQLLGWSSSQDVPNKVEPILSLVDAVADCVRTSQASGPIILHCINGIGRSGVFAAIFSASEKMVTDSSIDIFQAVKRLRANRPAMVESVAQYHLCYEAMAEYMKKFDEYANLAM